MLPRLRSGILICIAWSVFFVHGAPADAATHSAVVLQLEHSDTVLTIPFTPGTDVGAIAREYQQHPAVRLAEPNALFHATRTPDDPLYVEQRHHEIINSPEAWETTPGTSTVVIAVLDTGVDIDHQDIEGNIWTNSDEVPGNGKDDDGNGYIDDVHGYDFVDDDGDPNPSFSGAYSDDAVQHGTVVAGVASARGNNASGVAGVSWRARIMVLRVLDSNGVGNTQEITEAVQYAQANGADIINMSFVGSTSSAVLAGALDDAFDQGVLLVAAVGNDGVNLDSTKRYPVCNDGSENRILGVAATNVSDKKTSWSNYGTSCVDVAAPGTEIMSTAVYAPGEGFSERYLGNWQGTSFSAPVVSGVAALLLSANNGLSATALQTIIRDTAVDLSGVDPQFAHALGGGRVDAEAAVAEAVGRSSAPTIATGPGPGGGSALRFFDRYGSRAGTATFLAYDEAFFGGAAVALGDVDGDGLLEVVTGPGPGGGPHIRIFSLNGDMEGEFFAYDQGMRNGVTVAVADLNGDGTAEIITGTGPGSTTHVRTFTGSGDAIFTPGFFAYDDGYRNGVTVAAGDLDRDGDGEIVTGTGPGSVPLVRTFDRYGTATFTPGFYAYDDGFRGGVNVAVGDLDGDRDADIVTGTGPGSTTHVRTFDRYGAEMITPGFFAYDLGFRKGVIVAVADLDGDGRAEIVTAPGPGGGPHVRTFGANGEPLFTPGFFAYDTTFSGGVFVAAARP